MRLKLKLKRALAAAYGSAAAIESMKSTPGIGWYTRELKSQVEWKLVETMVLSSLMDTPRSPGVTTRSGQSRVGTAERVGEGARACHAYHIII